MRKKDWNYVKTTFIFGGILAIGLLFLNLLYTDGVITDAVLGNWTMLMLNKLWAYLWLIVWIVYSIFQWRN